MRGDGVVGEPDLVGLRQVPVLEKRLAPLQAGGHDPVEQGVDLADETFGLFHAADLVEFTHIRADDERAGLARLENQASGRLGFQHSDDAFEFFQDVLREAVGRLAGAVERQPADAVHVGFQAPVPLQPPYEHAGNFRAFSGDGALLFDDRGEGQHLVR